MKKLWLLFIFALLLCGVKAHAATCATLSGPSQSALQSALNSCGSGNTLQLNAGSTTLTSSINYPCGVILLGPTANPALAKITTSTPNISLFTGDNCTSGASTGFEYLQLDGAGAFHTFGSSFSNFVFKNNQTTNVPSEYCGAGCNQPCVSCQSIYFNFNSGITLTNLDIEFNSFGDSNSCSASAGFVPFSVTSDNFPGNCAGLIIASQNPGAVVNLTLQYNTFNHLEEGFHMMNVGFSANAPDSYCSNCLVQYNYFHGIRRIQVEYQAQMFNNPLRFRYNVMGPPDYSSANAGQYAFSLPCCQFGQIFGTTTNTFLDASSNLIYDPSPTTSSTNGISWGYEAWGYGPSSYNNNLIQGYVCVGFNYGFVTSATTFSNNTMQGSVMANTGGAQCTFAGGGTGGYIGAEFGSCAGVTPCPPPTISGNVGQSTPTSFISKAPTISPSGGTQTFPLTVTLTDAGYTTGTLPLANTGIWYTTDGSTPIPGSGTAKRVDSGGTFLLMGPATVQAVGMWGALNQPTSYPSGYGYVPSPVISAVFKGGSGSRLVSAYLVSNGGVKSIPVGGTLQFIAHGVYSDGTSSVLPDSEGNMVTAWNTSDHAVAKISSLGHVTAMGVGTATIEAFIGNLEASTSAVTVTPIVASSVLVSAYLVSNGGVKSIPVGKTLQFIAHGVYSDGTSAVLPDPAGNAVTAWNTSNHNIAKISSLGHATAMGVGTATIEAFIGNLEASTSEVAVTPIVASNVQTAAIESPLAPRIESPSGSVPAVPGSPIGDTFLGPLWKVFTPAGGSASISNGHLFLSVPGGSNHDTLVPSNQAVRAVQAIGDTDFDVSIKIDSEIEASNADTSQGLMVLSDDDAFITFALTTDGTNIGLVARTVDAGVSTTVLEDTSFTQYQNPMYLRLARSGVAYMASYSTDGLHWTQATSFTVTGTYTSIGPFDSNYNKSPQHAVPVVMSVDWFNVE